MHIFNKRITKINNNMILNIKKQPAPNFHYRSIGGQRGVLTSYQTKQEKLNGIINYPQVNLSLPPEQSNTKGNFFILVSIHNYANKCLSPHLLMRRCETKENYGFIFDKMTSISSLEYFWELKDYVIVRSTQNAYRLTFLEKQREYEKLRLPLEFELLKGDVDIENENSRKQSGDLIVSLGFTIFEKISIFGVDTFRLCQTTQFSNAIYDGDDLCIKRICNPKGYKNKFTEITLLIRFNSKYPISVIMNRRNDRTQEIEWTKVIAIQYDIDHMFHNAAITFKAPPYDGPSCSDDEIITSIHVAVDNSLYRSNDVKFCYINDDEEALQRKRLRIENENNVAINITENQSNPVPIYNYYITFATNTNENLTHNPNEPNLQLPLETVAANRNESQSSFISEVYLDNSCSAVETICNGNQMNLPAYERQINHEVDNNLNDLFLDVDLSQLSPCDLENPEYDIDELFDRFQDVVPQTLNYTNIDPKNISRDSETFEIYKNALTDRMSSLNVNNSVEQNSEPLEKNNFEDGSHNFVESAAEDNSRNQNLKFMTKHKKSIKIMEINKKDCNIFFHQALLNNCSLERFYVGFKNTSYEPLVRQVRNDNRENFLHYACKHNKAFCIRPLIGLGCRINEQDIYGRTPLHIALDYQYNECVLKIQKLLENHSKYPKEVKECFIKMFKVYNRKGYTVLHLAVLENNLKLVEIMLKFCQEHHINIFDYEVLGNGDSMVHLMVKHNLIDMAKVFNSNWILTNYITITNYCGQTALESTNISAEMMRLLS